MKTNVYTVHKDSTFEVIRFKKQSFTISDPSTTINNPIKDKNVKEYYNEK